jgi:uncharacterized protein with HEPN domain
VSRDWRLFIADIIEHGERVQRLLHARAPDSLETDETLRRAVLFSLLIIGEASKQIPQSLRDLEPGVNWRGAAGLRDIIVHHSTLVSTQTSFGMPRASMCRGCSTPRGVSSSFWITAGRTKNATTTDPRAWVTSSRSCSRSRGYGIGGRCDVGAASAAPAD